VREQGEGQGVGRRSTIMHRSLKWVVDLPRNPHVIAQLLMSSTSAKCLVRANAMNPLHHLNWKDSHKGGLEVGH
jgi:hypothetical protein